MENPNPKKLTLEETAHLLEEFKKAYEDSEVSTIEALNEKFKTSRVSVEIKIKERIHQKCLEFNGASFLRVYYAISLFGFDLDQGINSPVLRTWHPLVPTKSFPELSEDQCYHLDGALLRATPKHLAIVLDYHSRVTTGVDQFDLILVAESDELSKLVKQNPVFKQFEEVKELEQTADITLADALIWHVRESVFLQHAAFKDSIAEYQAIVNNLNAEPITDLIVVVKEAHPMRTQDSKRRMCTLPLRIWSAIDGSETMLYVKHPRTDQVQIHDLQVIRLNEAQRRLSAKLDIYLACHIKSVTVIGRMSSGINNVPVLCAPPVALSELQWGRVIARSNVQLSVNIQKVERVILEEIPLADSQEEVPIPINLSVDCTIDDGTGVAKVKLRNEKAVRVFNLNQEALKTLEYEVKGKKSTLLTYKSDVFRRLFVTNADFFTVIGKPQCKINFSVDPYDYDQQAGISRPIELKKSEFKGVVFLNGMSRRFKTAKPQDSPSEQHPEFSTTSTERNMISDKEDMWVRLNYVVLGVSEIYKELDVDFEIL